MKHRLLTCVFMFFACLTMVGQVNQVWWSKGRVLHVNPVAEIDSVTYGQFVNADTFLIVIDRASRRIVYDTIDVHVPGMVFHDTIHTTHTIYLEPGRRIGVFSVAKDKQVSFSQGNLQYIQNQNTWKFADQQYEYIGAGNIKDGKLANKIDLFGWSADNTTAPFGVSTSTNNADYAGEFVDWGVNEINIDKPNTWRTLSKDEWEYLINERDNAKMLRCRAQVNGVNGLVLLPDNWICPEEIELNLDEQATKLFTIAQWYLLEDAGALFLPAVGRRQGLGLININDHGNYWSSTRKNNNYAEYLAFTFSSNKLYVDAQREINLGRPVRLVRDTIVPPPAPCKTFDVNGVEFNMMCVEGGTFTMGAGSDAHQVTLSDYYIAQSELTQAQWEAVMGKIEKGKYAIEKYGDNYPMSGISLMQCQEFVDRLNELTGLHFRISTEAEWEYAARGGVKSKGYKYAGSDDINEVAIWNGTVRLDENGKNIYAPEPVMTRKPNELGIYDMSGNVAEWVNDWNGEFNLYPQINPTGPTTYTTTYSHRVHYRGGCWTFPEYKCEVTFKQPKNVHSITDPNRGFNGVGLRLVLSDEEPFKMVYVNDTTRIVLRPVKGEKYNYYIGETEVTYALWKAVMGSWPKNKKTGNRAVDGVTWGECQAFIDKLNEQTGLYFRFPTVEEWQYAAKGGEHQDDYLYSGSDNIDSVGWYNGNSGGNVGVHEVAQLMPNSLGVYDMTGNVWEWAAQLSNGNYPYLGGSYAFKAESCLLSKSKGTTPDANHTGSIGFRIVLDAHQYVDLGLSVKWATFNLGASAPEDYGDYFAWGETKPKEIYSWATYKLCNGTSSSSLTKYCSDSNYGNADYKTTLEPEDDAAYVNWGGNWRMPTEAEWIELRQKCTWKKTTINGVTGYRVTAKNGNSIFLPRAGLRMSKVEYAADSVGYYASSTHIPNFKKEDYAYYMLMYNNAIERSSAVRYYGLTIRPVYDDVPDPCMVVKVNDTLSINMMCVKGGTFMMGASDDDKKAGKDERPQHQVTLTYDYHIMQTEVTQGLWEAVMGEDIYDLRAKSRSPEEEIKFAGGDYPVFYVRFSQCLEFIERLNELTGLHFRMPSEAEWEYAARGGHLSKGYLYSGSNDANEVAAIGYVAATGYAFKPVASLRPNELGIYDMSGNIAEMTLDFAHGVSAPYPSAEPQINPRQISPIKEYAGNRMFRNSHPRVADSVRVTQRYPYTPTWCGNWMGFRLVLAEDYDFKTILVNNVAFEMSFVKGGTFTMGDDSSNNTSPAHQVTLSDYYIGQTEVTQALWKAVMGTNPSNQNDDPYKPVGNVSWDDAQLFVEKLSKKTGLNFRLPTEAEWEYAAMGGKLSQVYKYPGSDNIDDVAWYDVNSDNKVHVVGTKMPNELGIYDMSGNVWEWVSDWYGNYSTQKQINPQGPSSGTVRVLRSGSYVTQDASRCAIKNRQARRADYPDAHIGFRIVLDTNVRNCYTFTQEHWDAATDSWGHGGRGHAPSDQSCIQGTIVHGVRLKVAARGSLNVYKVPSLTEKTEDNFELVATLTTDSTGVQDFDFPQPIYVGPNEYLVFGKPSDETPTLRPYYIAKPSISFPTGSQGIAHFIGDKKAKNANTQSVLMVEFY